jgi:large subunit ribosomal protein L25
MRRNCPDWAIERMEQARLEAQLRANRGKSAARATRREGFIPGIIYGHKQKPLAIKLPERRFRRFVSSSGENVLINLSIGDSEEETVMIKEVQIDPVTRRVIHADFMRVSLEERVTTHIPITTLGKAPGVEEGGVLAFPHRELQIECEVGRLPEDVKIDISSLNVGDQIRVGELELEEGILVLDDPATVIVTVGAPTIIQEEEEEIGVLEEELMEPEVIGEKREEEEEEVEEE